MKVKLIETFRDLGSIKGHLLRKINITTPDIEVSEFWSYVRVGYSYLKLVVVGWIGDEGVVCKGVARNYQEYSLYEKFNCNVGDVLVLNGEEIIEFDKRLLDKNIADELYTLCEDRQIEEEDLKDIDKLKQKLENLKAEYEKNEKEREEKRQKEELEEEKSRKAFENGEEVILENKSLKDNTLSWDNKKVTFSERYNKILEYYHLTRSWYVTDVIRDNCFEKKISFTYEQGECKFEVNFEGDKIKINNIPVPKNKYKYIVTRLLNKERVNIPVVAKMSGWIGELLTLDKVSYIDIAINEIIDIPVNIQLEDKNFKIIVFEKEINLKEDSIRDLFFNGRRLENNFSYEKLLNVFEMLGFDEDYLLEYLRKKRAIALIKKEKE